jgi:signal transduction histidine kinase
MTEVNTETARGRLRTALAFAAAAEPRAPVSKRAIRNDVILAAALLVASLFAVKFDFRGGIAAILTCGPVAMRRVYPLGVFLGQVALVLATREYATYFTFIALVTSAYSAVLRSRYRGAALISMAPAGMLVAAVFWHSSSHLRDVGIGPVPSTIVRERGMITVRPLAISPFPGRLAGLTFGPSAPWRLTGILVLVCFTSIAAVGAAVYAADWIRHLKAEHEAATRRAIEVERSRIASDLHDVVTHNVSVMIVQAGAARQVLANSPAQATEALLAVESSGRAAMTELRHLLGLLSPVAEYGEGDAAGGAAGGTAGDLRPQPGLGQIEALIGRVAAAGLPVELTTGPLPAVLTPGVDLAAYRIVQEALTNVIKHAGKPRTTVMLDYRDGDLIVEVADAGRAMPAVGPICPGAGRGLLGLRERAALYGGELAAGPAPGGGWLVRARIPADPAAASAAPAGVPAAALAASQP